jgi:hypothetical protein
MEVRYASGVVGVAAASCPRKAAGVRAASTKAAKAAAFLATSVILPVKGMYTIELSSPESGIGAFALHHHAGSHPAQTRRRRQIAYAMTGDDAKTKAE